jgi:hypothetical protein
MISAGSGGNRHFSWTFTDGEYPPGFRSVYANCKNPAGAYLGEVDVDTSTNTDPGYCNQSHTWDDRSVVVYHRLAFVSPGPPTYCMLTMDNYPCIGDYTMHWDLPDSILNADSGEKGKWPRLAVKYNEEVGTDYHHVVVTEGYTTSLVPEMMAYQRCYQGSMGTLICQAYVDGLTQTYTLYPNANHSNPANIVAHFDSTCHASTVVVEVSPVSERVVIAFVKPACDGSCEYLGDVAYVESMTNGDDWIDGSNYPPPDHNITNYGCGYPEDERALIDVSACYDYQDSLHIVWSTVGFLSPGAFDPAVSKLYHWSKEAGSVMVANAIWGGTDPAFFNANISTASISAMDPIFHPPDSNYLYCIWAQFDPGDTSAIGYGNGDIYGAGSRDGGATWGPSYNLTNTKTPLCDAGDCLSEQWPSLAGNLHGGYLHIQYVCDKDAGPAIAGYGEWTDNPVMYLELEAWDPGTSYLRGDANGDGIINVGDIVYLVSYLYKSGPVPAPIWVGDCNCDEIVNVGDVVYLVSYLYKGGPPPGCP